MTKFNCKNCGKCCQFGSGFLVEQDKKRIANHLNIDVNMLEKKYLEKLDMFGTEAWRPRFPKPFGPCIFFDKKARCTIHEVKPTLCKEADCEHDATEDFYEKHFVDKNNAESLEMWELRKELE